MIWHFLIKYTNDLEPIPDGILSPTNKQTRPILIGWKNLWIYEILAGISKCLWTPTLHHQMYGRWSGVFWHLFLTGIPLLLLAKQQQTRLIPIGWLKKIGIQLETLKDYELRHSIIKCTADDLESFGTYSWPEYLPHCWPNNGLADAADSSWIYGRLPKSLCLFPFSDWRSDGIAKLFKNCKLFFCNKTG